MTAALVVAYVLVGVVVGVVAVRAPELRRDSDLATAIWFLVFVVTWPVLLGVALLALLGKAVRP